MVVSVFGSVILINPEHPENASRPMFVTPSSISTIFNASHAEKVYIPISETLAGKETFCKEKHP